MAYSLMTATLPTFQNFLKSLNTGFGRIGAGGSGYEYGYGYGSVSGSRARKESSMNFKMSKLRSADKSVALDDIEEDQDRGATSAQASTQEISTGGLSGRRGTETMGQWPGNESANGETASIRSDESQRMIIRKDIQWSVQTEARK